MQAVVLIGPTEMLVILAVAIVVVFVIARRSGKK